jgi:hypothetical protein
MRRTTNMKAFAAQGASVVRAAAITAQEWNCPRPRQETRLPLSAPARCSAKMANTPNNEW